MSLVVLGQSVTKLGTALSVRLYVFTQKCYWNHFYFSMSGSKNMSPSEYVLGRQLP